MSCSYADGLSPYENKGKLGLEEKFDSIKDIEVKLSLLAEWLTKSNHVVVHTGAGISTSAGIPDFRGPKGVWTLEAKGMKPDMNISFNDAIPTKTHMALAKLIKTGKIHYIVSQNIDGLHLRSGVPRKCLSELHGNMFIEQCNQCSRQYVMNSATTSVGQKCLEKACPSVKPGGRLCRGRMHDTILDWENNLPEKDLGLADFHSCVADLSICLGTTMQIIPSGNLPLNTKKYNNGKLVICNLQPTKHDKKADLLIHTYVDDVMDMLMGKLGLTIEEYSKDKDPVFKGSKSQIEWTIANSEVKRMRKLYEQTCCKRKVKREKKIEHIFIKKSKIDTNIKDVDKCILENKNVIKLEDSKNLLEVKCDVVGPTIKVKEETCIR
uniref:protein acetyllysine N-acetyltransferase n=2 Tax=Clastoptera arizonana TaxID=38151 RepID=A0A1B6CB19_9HEMI